MTESVPKARPSKAAAPAAPTGGKSAAKVSTAKKVAVKSIVEPIVEPVADAAKATVRKVPAPTALKVEDKAAPVKTATAAKKSTMAVEAPAAKAPIAPKRQTPPAAASAGATRSPLSDEQRYRMIAEAAYFRAESNQFKSDPVRDWIEAEAAVTALLADNR